LRVEEDVEEDLGFENLLSNSKLPIYKMHIGEVFLGNLPK
jgi:hypothetical protein